MNQTFSSHILLIAIVLLTLALFVVGLMLKPKPKSQTTRLSNTSNKQLIKLKKLIAKHFPDFTATMREHHLVLERNAKKVAMLTLDVNAALGRRRLGEVDVINFHQLPSLEELRIELSGV